METETKDAMIAGTLYNINDVFYVHDNSYDIRSDVAKNVSYSPYVVLVGGASSGL